MAKDEDRTSRRRVRTRVETTIDDERGVFMISVAAELAEMHPQTLRMYEARGLITPQRSPKKTRLYSQSDVERLRRLQQMTTEDGLVVPVLRKLGADVEGIAGRARQAVESLPTLSGEASPEVRPSGELVRTLQRAEKESAAMGDEYISTEHVLLALADEASGVA